jgi:hypothetical protein
MILPFDRLAIPLTHIFIISQNTMDNGINKKFSALLDKIISPAKMLAVRSWRPDTMHRVCTLYIEGGHLSIA